MDSQVRQGMRFAEAVQLLKKAGLSKQNIDNLLFEASRYLRHLGENRMKTLKENFVEFSKDVEPVNWSDMVGESLKVYNTLAVAPCLDQDGQKNAAVFRMPIETTSFLDRAGLLFKNKRPAEFIYMTFEQNLPLFFNWVITRSTTTDENYEYDVIFAQVDNTYELGAKHALLAQYVSPEADIMIAGEMRAWLDKKQIMFNLNSSNMRHHSIKNENNTHLSWTLVVMLCQLLKYCETPGWRLRVQELCEMFGLDQCALKTGENLYPFYKQTECFNKDKLAAIEKAVGEKFKNYSLLRGSTVKGKRGTYTIVSQIGSEGANSMVFKVQDERGKFFADKISQNMFLSEIDLLTRFDHPNLLHAYEIFLDDRGLLHIVMSLAKEDLKTALAKNPPLKVRIRWLYQILSAVIFLHGSGYYHCDLKTENILIFNDKAVVADFGLSGKTGTNKPWSCGTVTWYGPETQDSISGFMGGSWDGPSADVFGLAIVFSALLLDNNQRLIKPSEGPQLVADLKKKYANLETEIKDLKIDEDWKALFLKMTLEKAKARPTLVEVLQAPPFVSRGFSKPIPGSFLVSKRVNYQKRLPNVLKQVLQDALDQGEEALDLSGLAFWLFPFIDLARTVPENLCSPEHFKWILCDLVLTLYNEQTFYGDIYDEFDDEKKVSEYLFKLKSGSIRTKFLTDVAVSHDECFWGIEQMLIADSCPDADALHFEYCSKVETTQQLDNRVPLIRNIFMFYWKPHPDHKKYEDLRAVTKDFIERLIKKYW